MPREGYVRRLLRRGAVSRFQAREGRLPTAEEFKRELDGLVADVSRELVDANAPEVVRGHALAYLARVVA